MISQQQKKEASFAKFNTILEKDEIFSSCLIKKIFVK